MTEPVVSIIVPVYKVPEQYLRQCIDSLTSQTLEKIEIILVDDGSPDQCGKVCDEYAKQDERIRVLHKKNEGVCSARNEGINLATGKYLSFLDGDDWIEKDTYRSVVDIAEEKSYGLISWNHYYNKEPEFDDNIPRTSMPEEQFIYDKKAIIERLQYDFITPEYDIRKYGTNLGAIRGVWGKLYVTEVVKKNRDIISLLEKARAIQLNLLQENNISEIADDFFISSPAIRAAYSETSREKLVTQLYAEYPAYRTWIELFKNSKAEHNDSTLQQVLGKQWKSRTEKLVQIGFLEKKKNTYKIPFIYRVQLNISQGRAK